MEKNNKHVLQATHIMAMEMFKHGFSFLEILESIKEVTIEPNVKIDIIDAETIETILRQAEEDCRNS